MSNLNYTFQFGNNDFSFTGDGSLSTPLTGSINSFSGSQTVIYSAGISGILFYNFSLTDVNSAGAQGYIQINGNYLGGGVLSTPGSSFSGSIEISSSNFLYMFFDPGSETGHLAHLDINSLYIVNVINYSADGGTIASGNALVSVNITRYSTGGIEAGGDSTDQTNYNHPSIGGVETDGAALALVVFLGSGGVEASGYSSNRINYNYSGIGGIEIGGDSTDQTNYNHPSIGGVETDGAALALVVFLGSGGVEASGYSSNRINYNYSGIGGIEIGGDSTDQTNYNHPSIGGVETDGNVSAVKVIPISGIGGVEVDGNVSAVRFIIFSGSGGVVGNGNSNSYIVFNPSSSGGLVASGNSTDIVLVNSSLSIPILFDLGTLPVYAYRVVSICSKLDCTQIPLQEVDNSCDNQVISYILARNLGDVCVQLASYSFIFRVQAVYKYSRAIFGKDYLQDLKNNLVVADCPDFTDVTDDFCTEAQCFDFCVPRNNLFIAKGSFTASYYHPNESTVNLVVGGGYSIRSTLSNYSYSGTGTLTLNGIANASGINLMPLHIFTGSGNITLSGTSDVNNYYLGEYTVVASVFFTVSDFSVNTIDNSGLKLIGDELNNTSNICGCKRLLNYVNFESNLLTKTSTLSNFLYRNSISPNKITKLYFNQLTKTFFNSLKFDGIGSVSSETESWNVVLELACTTQVNLAGESLWKLSFFIQRKTYTNKVQVNNLETIFYVFIPSKLIYNSSSLLQFDFQIDIKNLVVYRRFKDIIFDLQPRIVKDNIKLFSSGDWLADSFLEIYVFSINTAYAQIFRPNRNSRKINILSLLESP